MNAVLGIVLMSILTVESSVPLVSNPESARDPNKLNLLQDALRSAGVSSAGIALKSIIAKREKYRTIYRASYANKQGQMCSLDWQVVIGRASPTPMKPICENVTTDDGIDKATKKSVARAYGVPGVIVSAEDQPGVVIGQPAVVMEPGMVVGQPEIVVGTPGILEYNGPTYIMDQPGIAGPYVVPQPGITLPDYIVSQPGIIRYAAPKPGVPSYRPGGPSYRPPHGAPVYRPTYRPASPSYRPPQGPPNNVYTPPPGYTLCLIDKPSDQKKRNEEPKRSGKNEAKFEMNTGKQNATSDQQPQATTSGPTPGPTPGNNGRPTTRYNRRPTQRYYNRRNRG